ncbi:hypothetical protein JXA63_02785 [Candidatus Woesebacteria bacterium]|nr:hypothetical protein [Candidatus Woesebacteria bacterium]
MKFFTKSEIKIVAGVLMFLFLISSYNFRLALRRARDAQRKADLGEIEKALLSYHRDFGYFPPSNEDGEIVACFDGDIKDLVVPKDVNGNTDIKAYFKQFRGCEWGNDGLRDVTEPEYPAYSDRLPGDPSIMDGFSYKYISNFTRFQLYAHLEGKDSEDEYKKEIELRDLDCGVSVCNFGIGYGKTPLDVSIEKYESSLRN